MLAHDELQDLRPHALAMVRYTCRAHSQSRLILADKRARELSELQKLGETLESFVVRVAHLPAEGNERHFSFPDYCTSCIDMDLQDSALTCAEFEDLNGGCPEVNASQPRPSYLLPLNPNKDPWSWYQRTLTFQVSNFPPAAQPCESCTISSHTSTSTRTPFPAFLPVRTGGWSATGYCSCMAT